MRQIINREINPSFNLAFEEEILQSDYIADKLAFCLWRNPRSVIVGVSQVAENEVNLKYCRDNSIPVVRRRTGGGAVFHDLGNLNFSFFFPRKPEGDPYRYVYGILRPAFKAMGVDIAMSPTNDLLLDGRKFSGMAERVIGERALVHGTMLFDTDFKALANALTTESSKFTKPRGVASRRAEVINLKGHLPGIEDINRFGEELSGLLSDECSTIHPDKELLNRIQLRATTHYTPLNQSDINGYI